MRYLRANRDAVTALLGTILVITLVMSSIAVIGIWGIPYIENSKIRSHHDASYATFNVIDNAVEGLISSGSGASGKFNIANYVNYGSVSIDSEGDRLVVIYSYDEEYTFNVSGLVDDSDTDFVITVDNGKTLDNAIIYWLNDTCFLAGTKVAMADGSYKNIEDIRIGDFVKSYDEQNNVLVNCKVTQMHHHTPEEMPEYYLVINDELKVTPNHKFYSNGEWICAGDLKVGDSLFCKEIGKDYLINSIEKVYEKVRTYDLTVESCHNFFVNVEDVDVLVHNQEYTATLHPDAENYPYYYNDTTYIFQVSTDLPGATEWNFSWGNGTISDWKSDTDGNWKESGFYEVRVKAKNATDETTWSEPLGVYIREKVKSPTDFLQASTGSITVAAPTYTIDAGDHLEGAICIDLYSTNYPSATAPARGKVPFGRIWLFDLGSITHTMPSAGGYYKTILENDAIVAVSSTGGYVSNRPIMGKNDEVLRFNVVQIRNRTNSIAGSGKGVYKLKIEVKDQYVRESLILNSNVYDFKIQVSGKNKDYWIDYFEWTKCFEQFDTTLTYIGGDKPLQMTSAIVKASLEGIK